MLAVERNSIRDDKFELRILGTKPDFFCEEIACFNCGEGDLNEFFHEDAFTHKEHLLAETYCFQPIEVTEEGLFFPVALISFLNDSIVITKEERKGGKRDFWRHLKKNIPHSKRHYPSFPAVKIGRLGVKREYQDQQFGTALLNMTKEFFLTKNRTGCRFITVDAYNEERVTGFYHKNGFQFLSDQDKEKETRIMFYDLKRHKLHS